jgi:hypothetical protein
MKDRDFLAEAKIARLEVQPKSGADLVALMKQVYATPKPVVETVGRLIQ